eukprot:CAMPEP_0179070568 /NCGR_PEP_ID=MMETSP0796-20121207/31084_1 /TAXON_ID=73915 /ORGANISM="Pyrodinium bahamense, Strain pbaha01" /LENGTH=224 /DNA_ID=CAMNT_0020767657 /DNA_START=81 /DNA_END=752 /DNA_ORIENTATION=-
MSAMCRTAGLLSLLALGLPGGARAHEGRRAGAAAAAAVDALGGVAAEAAPAQSFAEQRTGSRQALVRSERPAHGTQANSGHALERVEYDINNEQKDVGVLTKGTASLEKDLAALKTIEEKKAQDFKDFEQGHNTKEAAKKLDGDVREEQLEKSQVVHDVKNLNYGVEDLTSDTRKTEEAEMTGIKTGPGMDELIQVRPEFAGSPIFRAGLYTSAIDLQSGVIIA